MCRVFSGEASRPAANAQPMRAYWVRHMRGFIVEAQFEALAMDSLACATDHCAPEGCRTIVVPLAEWQEKCRAEQNARGDINAAGWAHIDADLGITRPDLAKWRDQMSEDVRRSLDVLALDASREKMRDEYESGLDAVPSARQERAAARRDQVGGGDE